MHTLRFISRIAKKAGFLLVFLLTLSSCFSNTVWNLKPDDFLARLQRGDVAFLRTIDYKSVRLDEVMRLGPNAPYYLSYVYTDLGMPELARAMLRMEWRRGSGFWQEEAGKLLVTDYIRDGEYQKAEEAARQIFAVYPGRDVYRGLLVALYWQHKDGEVLTALRKIASFRNPDGTPIEDRELALFQAVASARLDAGGWHQLFTKLFTTQPASDLQVRAMEFLTQDPTRESGFSAQELSLFGAKRDIALGKFADALTAMKPLVDAKDPLLLTASNLGDLGRAYVGAGTPLAGARFFTGLIAGLRAGTGSESQLYTAYEALGRLYHDAGYYGDAIDAYTRALGATTDAARQDRMIWYILSSELAQSPAGTVPLLRAYAKEWHDPSFFDDVLGELCTALVEGHRWKTLAEAYTALDGYADKAILSRYAFVVGSAIHSGLLRPSDATETESALFSHVIQLDANLYYVFLASARLDRVPSFLTGAPSLIPAGAPRGTENTDRENLIMGFLSYGLYREAYGMARDNLRQMGPATLDLLAKRLTSEGHLIQALRLLEAALDTAGFLPTAEDLSLLYPQPYLSIVRQIAQENQLKLPVFYALVREESYFDPKIVSAAGAVGLSQLMPATAQDISHRMRLKDPDLTKPAENLAIGGHYLAQLLERFDGNTGQALFAYNAGYMRVERWMAEYRDLPSPLFLEALPFQETQDYGRKILVSAVAYGYLYYGLRPVDIIKEILPGF